MTDSKGMGDSSEDLEVIVTDINNQAPEFDPKFYEGTVNGIMNWSSTSYAYKVLSYWYY